MCHLRTDRPAWATVPPRDHSAEVNLTATSVAVTARTAATDATGVWSRQRPGAPAAHSAAIRLRARCLACGPCRPWVSCLLRGR